MPRQLKAYTLELVFSKLMFPESVIGLILDYGCKVNDYLLVLSTPSHYNFEVWAMWADFDDISEATGIPIEQLKQTLQSLSRGKFHILNKFPEESKRHCCMMLQIW